MGGRGHDKDAIDRWKEDIVGDWLEELVGIDPLFLKPVAGRVPAAFSLRADGTALTQAGTSGHHAVSSRPEAPFAETWELSTDRVLSIVAPVPPMPEYDMPDWSRQRLQWDVLAVSDLSLTLSDRRFDGEMVTVWRRVNCEEYERRKYG